MAFPVNGVLDQFNRADGGLGSAWTANLFGSETGTLAIASNAATGPSADVGRSWWNASVTSSADCEVFIDLPTVDTTRVFSRIINPGSGSASGYAASFGFSGVLQYHRIDNAVRTVLGANEAWDATAGDSVGLDVTGSTLTAEQKVGGTWSSVSSRSDATYTAAGVIALELTDVIVSADSFGGGPFVSGPGPMILGQPDLRRPSFGPF
jgi:hypothetical protein